MHVIENGYSRRNVCTCEWIQYAYCTYLGMDTVCLTYGMDTLGVMFELANGCSRPDVFTREWLQ